ncbi:MAG: hypothetical protein AAF986_04010 [Pseudomonadota bacterium]
MPGGYSRFAISAVLIAIGAMVVGLLFKGPDHHRRTELAPDFYIFDDKLTLEAAIPALKTTPLAETPLIVRSYFDYLSGDLNRANAATAQALLRNPRSIPALVWQAKLAVEQSHPEDAVRALANLVRLDRRNAHIYVDALATLATKDEFRPALMVALESDAHWAMRVVDRLNQGMDNASFLYALNTPRPVLREQYISELVSRKQYDSAFSAWLSYLPEEELGDFAWPYNGDFEDRRTPQPFNWVISERHAEIQSSGGLYTIFLGKGRPVFAYQLMALRPGEYHFEAVMEGKKRQGGGTLVWVIKCLSAGTIIGEAYATAEVLQGGSLSIRFDIPSTSCRFQNLSLVGRPGEFPMPTNATTQRVLISQRDDEEGSRNDDG